MNQEELDDYVDKTVVVDTAAPYVYIGTLRHVGSSFVSLQDADVHHVEPGTAAKEIYVVTARKYGININRLSVKIRVDFIVSISLLEDVVEY